MPVEEGRKYTRRELSRSRGNQALRTEGIRQFITLKEGDVFSLEKLRKSFEKLKEMYGAFGYYQWTPDTEMKPRGIDMETGKPIGEEEPPPIMDLTIKMNEGKQFFVNRITFTGNHTTHDAVIRRELRVAEGAVFNGEALKGSIRRLNQLGYFKPLEGNENEMEVKPTPDTDDQRRHHAQGPGAEPQPARVRRGHVAVRGRVRPVVVPDAATSSAAARRRASTCRRARWRSSTGWRSASRTSSTGRSRSASTSTARSSPIPNTYHAAIHRRQRRARACR